MTFGVVGIAVCLLWADKASPLIAIGCHIGFQAPYLYFAEIRKHAHMSKVHHVS